MKLNNGKITKIFIIQSFIINIFTSFTYFYCTIFGAILMLFLGHDNSSLTLGIKVAVSVTLVISRLHLIYKKTRPITLEDSSIYRPNISIIILVAYAIDILLMIAVIFARYELYLYYSVILIWLLISLFRAFRYYVAIKDLNVEKLLDNIKESKVSTYEDLIDKDDENK